MNYAPRTYIVRFTAIVCLLFVASVNGLRAQDQSDTGKVSPSTPHVELGSVKDAKPEELAKITEAIANLNKVLASPEFKSDVLSMHASTKAGHSNQEIYDLMVSKSPIKLNVNVFDGTPEQNEKYHTEGYEEESEPNTCFVNRYFWKDEYKYSAGFLSSLMLHESTHVLGFVHHNLWRKHSSVPYTMNYIYDDVAPKLGLPSSSVPR